jgi:hypothetical protein
LKGLGVAVEGVALALRDRSGTEAGGEEADGVAAAGVAEVVIGGMGEGSKGRA